MTKQTTIKAQLVIMKGVHQTSSLSRGILEEVEGISAVPKVEEKGRLITNPTRCFKCNGLGHKAINCPTKRTLIFREDLNGWIEKNGEDCLEMIVDDRNSHDDGTIRDASLYAEEDTLSLVTIRSFTIQIIEDYSSIQRQNIFRIYAILYNIYVLPNEENKE
ncbi:hypothetical protein M9H77_08825 [Catharanthus roseus]|uniref:Uncharacterized protein n=1 Tax=Catharanthus roseus TaxID=4058 RepID=A0ACC0BYZ1_CATRO|nr:hypothetical protein M9H77_08825 [Catharanthus roseus]